MNTAPAIFLNKWENKLMSTTIAHLKNTLEQKLKEAEQRWEEYLEPYSKIAMILSWTPDKWTLISLLDEINISENNTNMEWVIVRGLNSNGELVWKRVKAVLEIWPFSQETSL